MGDHVENPTNGGKGRNEDSTGHDGRGVTRTEDGKPHVLDQILANQPASASTTDLNSSVEPDVDQLNKDFKTKVKVAEPAGHVDRQGVEPGEDDNATVPVADGENGDGHLAEASTRAAIPACHAKATSRGIEDVKRADVNDTPPKEGTSTMPRGDKDERGSSPVSWPQEIERLKSCIRERESNAWYWHNHYQSACQELDRHKNAAAEVEKNFRFAESQWQSAVAAEQHERRERQLSINDAAEKAEEIMRFRKYSAEYLSRLKDIKQMLSNSSNPGKDGLLNTVMSNITFKPEAKPRVADAKQDLSRLIEEITRNLSPSKRSDVGAQYIVPQGNEMLEAERKSFKHAVASLEAERNSLKHAVASLEAERNSLKHSVASLEAERNSLKHSVASLEAERNSLKHAVANFEAEINSLKHANANLGTENAQIQKNLRNMEIEHGRISQSGAYRENSATPTHVSEGFTNLSVTVDSFKSRLVKYMLPNPSADSVNDAFSKDYEKVTPLRPNHLPALFLKAEATRILFMNFENESFTEEGYCICPDPAKRRKKFFDWFLQFRNHKGDQDEEFVRYYERIKARAWEKFGIQNSGKNVERLDNAFRKAAQNVWSLHLLSFSFEPPASLLRFRKGVAFDKSYMEVPPSVEVDQESVASVAFMMTPGLRVDKASLFKSEIYPVTKT